MDKLVQETFDIEKKREILQVHLIQAEISTIK